MSKTIILCADGTWNGPATDSKVSPLEEAASEGELHIGAVTNVAKLFANLAGDVTPETLALANEQEKVLCDGSRKPIQVAKYLHGVGDSRNPIVKLLGGTMGVGLINRIVRGYTFISREWEPGDDIHIAGFSRGAYTARALAGMIANVGLLNPKKYDPNDRTESYALGTAAWFKAKGAKISAGFLSGLANELLGAIGSAGSARLKDGDLIPDVPIKSVAVWDTVGSMGIPAYTAMGRFDILRFTDMNLSPKVERGFHAMAIDELRRDFPVTPWLRRAGVEQVWFVGAHSDVGGGYPTSECYLSDIALSWMMKKLATVGVKYTDPLAYVPKPQVLGGAYHTPWTKPPFNILKPDEARKVDQGDVLHASVRDRWDAPQRPPYRPRSIAAFGDSIQNARFDAALMD
jgi:hypothetical protein